MASLIKQATAKELANGNFEATDGGVLFPKIGVLTSGEYFGRVNGGPWRKEGDNLVVTQGLALILSIAFGQTAKPANFYIALFNGSATPAANWTAANFAANANEIVSTTEGWAGVSRLDWTKPTDTNDNQIDNMDSPAELTVITSSELIVKGAALLTKQTRGGTSGELVSASKYPAQRTFQNGDKYEVGYRVTLTD